MGSSLKFSMLIISILVTLLVVSYLFTFIVSTPNNLEKDLDIKKLIEEKEALRKLRNDSLIKNFEWKAEVVSKKLVKTFEGENYVVEIYEVTFRVPKPKLEELISSNKEYFDFLIKNLGEKGRAIVEETISKWEKWLSTIKGDTYEIKTKIVKVSPKHNGSIKFDSTLYNILSYGYYPSDPVNLVFYGPAGSAWDVQYDMKYWLSNKWSDTLGSTLYAILDKDHADDKDWIVKGEDYQLRYGDFWGESYHIRIYDGGYDWDQYLEWSIAGVHHEEWSWAPPGHKILGWEDAEQFVRSDFSGKWFVGSVWSWWLGNAQYYQDKWNDGYATAIELKY